MNSIDRDEHAYKACYHSTAPRYHPRIVEKSHRVNCLQHTSRENGQQSDPLRTGHLEPKDNSNWQQQDIDIRHAIEDGVDDATLPQCSAKV